MRDITFLLAVHNHQPVGNFPHVFRRAFTDCYRPFLDELSRHPAVKFTLHFSGPLWEYMKANEKKCWDTVRRLVERRQVELLGGGFYEPILSIIPEADRQSQLRLMTRFLEDHFGVRPRGIWLTERIWEPSLPGTLARAGVEYTILDEEHFHYAGLKNLLRPYITEDEGLPLVLFPVNKKLRYFIPFRLVDDIRGAFEEIAAGDGVAILGDDGEKFGLWPGTHKWVYEDGWLAGFLDFIEREGVRTLTYSEYLDSRPALGRAYLPPASYEEMTEWVLEPDDFARYSEVKQNLPAEARRFLRGGFFREFFLKYPESNHLHKRMLLVSRAAAREPGREVPVELLKAQGNDPFWHGVFGGLYLPHLREAAYRNLLEAEERLPLGEGWESRDYDNDGRDELIFRNKRFNLFVKPSYGGSLVELDDRGRSRNLSDVLSRREETYHRQKPAGEDSGKSIHELARKLPREAASLLRYDWHPRYSLLDHFLADGTTPESVRKIDYKELGDFVNQEYEFKIEDGSAVLSRSGHLWGDGEPGPLRVTKRLVPRPDGALVQYELENLSGRETPVVFGVEWNFYVLPNEWRLEDSALVLLGGRWRLEFVEASAVWAFPLRTLSQSESDYDIIHQGMSFLPNWRIILSPSQKHQLTITLSIRDGE
jgi:4-alpha-glucanotransferase